ncbi:MAG: hypothetical protein ACKO2A_08880, partial [Acidimicrobiaceae bacterium]
EHILQRMQLRAQQENTNTHNSSYFRPDTVTYNTILNALAKSGERDAAEKATNDAMARLIALHLTDAEMNQLAEQTIRVCSAAS